MTTLTHCAAIYLAKTEFLTELMAELPDAQQLGSNLVASTQRINACFALDVWLEPQIRTFQSISEAVKILRQAGKFWYLHPLQQVRRSRLIEGQLRRIPSLQQPFPLTAPIPPIGVFSLLDQHTLIYSAQRLKKWPDGQCQFIEDKINPPNRAYLKLWEAFAFLEKYPSTNESALDLGASPGGWTFVLQSLGAHVTAIDKAPLAAPIAQLPNVKCIQQSAFALDPSRVETTYDWVLSDIACYPDRAYALIKQWIDSGKARRLIFTIKLQGKIEMETIRQFQAIPNSQIINLFYNKHEATFFYPVT